jgi:uncharacterized membrane protein YtjA (UPF0391 family)
MPFDHLQHSARSNATALTALKEHGKRAPSSLADDLVCAGTIETCFELFSRSLAATRKREVQGDDDEIPVALDPGRPDSGPDPDLAHVGTLRAAFVTTHQEAAMLGWALTFLIVAIIAAIFGFGGIATTAAGIAQILFVVFIVLFLASLIYHLISGRRPPLP